MAAQALFKHGKPRFIDYTPSAGAITAGDVVVLRTAASNTMTGIVAGIAHHDIANNAPGSLAIGGGFYEAINLNNAADYAPVYWDDSVNKLTTTATNNAPIGAVSDNGGGGANSNCLFYHDGYAAGV